MRWIGIRIETNSEPRMEASRVIAIAYWLRAASIQTPLGYQSQVVKDSTFR